MPFKKKKNGTFEYDPKGNLKIQTDPRVFTQERPPVRDSGGRPLLGDGSGRVDWNKWADEIAEKGNRNES